MSKGACGRVLSEVIHKSAKIPEMMNSRLILRGRSNFTIVNTGWSTRKWILNFCRMVVILQMLLFLVCFLFPQLTFSWLYLLNVWFFPTFPTIDLFYGVHTVGVAVVLQMILLPRGESGCWDIARGRHSLCSHHHLHHLHLNHQYYRHYHSHDLLANRESGAWDVARGRHSV